MISQSRQPISLKPRIVKNKMTKTAYVLYSMWFDDVTFHAVFTSMEKLEAYTKEFILDFNQDGWHVVEIPVDPTDGEGL
jgi:hypothetical protein